jgi:hypothetical protein
MTQVERRALYNLLRMNWLNDPQLPVETWQVEDYRLLNSTQLFERLKLLSVDLDRVSLVAYADQCESPEELTDYLLGDREINVDLEDRMFLLIFELWRRFMSEKPSVSILCDELDYQIYLYDNGQLNEEDKLQKALHNFLLILNENVDEGVDPKEALALISNFCANDVETFLYDYIAEQIEQENESYAHELLDGFNPYLIGNKWFDLLRTRLAGHSKSANKYLSQITEEYVEEQDLEFNLELLSSMVEIGSPLLFREVVKHTLPLLSTEEDLQDLLTISIDYFHRLDNEKQEHLLQDLLKKRSQIALTQSIHSKDADLTLIQQILS